jgi:hypothetical protein
MHAVPLLPKYTPPTRFGVLALQPQLNSAAYSNLPPSPNRLTTMVRKKRQTEASQNKSRAKKARNNQSAPQYQKAAVPDNGTPASNSNNAFDVQGIPSLGLGQAESGSKTKNDSLAM